MKTGAFILLLICLRAFAAEPIEPPMPPSPIAEFRGWLEQSPEQRQLALAKRSQKSRQMLERKIEEYRALSPEERERRLSASEMQWYLKRLMVMPPAQRERAMSMVPVPWQPMVMERLSLWDKMAPEIRQRARDHKLVVEYLSTPPDLQRAVLLSLSPQERQTLTQRIAEWKILPALDRERMDERLEEFFNTAPEKQAQTINSFTDAERKVMKKTLEDFRALKWEQRALCIQSFANFTKRFAEMNPEERISFLKNVERWQEMTQQERDMWRQVVSVLPPMPELPQPQPPVPRGVPIVPTPP
jgi:hypothetical protein